MTDRDIEEMVEDIMRCYHMGSYEAYSSEELREKYRQMIKDGKKIERIKENGSC
jgi:hypothetical protein